MPLFKHRTSSLNEEPTKQYLAEAENKWALEVSALSSAQQAAFYRLYNCKSSEVPTTAGIVLTNSFGLGLGCCIFLIASRFNHSCLPNCNHGWDGRLGRKFVHTDRDVKCGDELTISYFEETKWWSHRQAELQWKYCFTCNCEVCEVPLAGVT